MIVSHDDDLTPSDRCCHLDPNLFRIASHPDLEVAKACVNGQWHIEFR